MKILMQMMMKFNKFKFIIQKLKINKLMKLIRLNKYKIIQIRQLFYKIVYKKVRIIKF